LLAALLAACSAVPLASTETPDLSCALPSNCVNSQGTGRMPPLRFDGPPAAALAALRATLASFPEARELSAGPAMLQAIFTTPAGFRDEVTFSVDTATQSIQFRSRSLVGLFDFRVNYGRMAEFTRRFVARPQP
jgi:uncharacterized protein (DUF1499 family)